MTVTILTGDVRAVLPTLPDGSVHCCVTSPPYWGLRDYGVVGQIGLEESIDTWVSEIVDVMREVRRVLRDDGTLWLNLGDSYASSGGAGWQGKDGQRADRRFTAVRDTEGLRKATRRPSEGLKPKDLIGQPWLVAFALRADGWYLRQEIIWHKPNPMPESVRDRCTKAHEQVFLLSKSPTYYYDFEAMQEPVNGGAHARLPGNKTHKTQTHYEGGASEHRTAAGLLAYSQRQAAKYKSPDGWDTRTSEGGHGSFHAEGREKGKVAAVGRRDGPPGNAAEHVVQALKETGNSMDSAYADGKSARMGRGAGWRERKLAEGNGGIKNNDSFDEAMAVMPDTRNKRSVWTIASEPFKEAHFATFPPALIEPCIKAGCPIGGIVLDPFGGAGTTGLVADRLQRNATLIELNPAYIEIAQRRIRGDAPLFAEVAAPAAPPPPQVAGGSKIASDAEDAGPLGAGIVSAHHAPLEAAKKGRDPGAGPSVSNQEVAA